VGVARDNDETIITHDLDYGKLLVFSNDPKPSVIIFRLRNVQVASLFSHITEKWEEFRSPLEQGAIVVIEDSAVRIRRLPIDEL
jgi:predicted nuclease of predicted toxin-antitoxin system